MRVGELAAVSLSGGWEAEGGGVEGGVLAGGEVVPEVSGFCLVWVRKWMVHVRSDG